jgi:hypothetical protein
VITILNVATLAAVRTRSLSVFAFCRPQLGHVFAPVAVCQVITHPADGLLASVFLATLSSFRRGIEGFTFANLPDI